MYYWLTGRRGKTKSKFCINSRFLSLSFIYWSISISFIHSTTHKSSRVEFGNLPREKICAQLLLASGKSFWSETRRRVMTCQNWNAEMGRKKKWFHGRKFSFFSFFFFFILFLSGSCSTVWSRTRLSLCLGVYMQRACRVLGNDERRVSFYSTLSSSCCWTERRRNLIRGRRKWNT